MDVSGLGVGVELLKNIVERVVGWDVRYNPTETEPALVVADTEQGKTLVFTEGTREAMDVVFSLLPDKKLQKRILRAIINHEQNEQGFLGQRYNHIEAHEKAMEQDTEECKMFRELVETFGWLSRQDGESLRGTEGDEVILRDRLPRSSAARNDDGLVAANRQPSLEQLREIWKQIEKGTRVLNKLREKNGMQSIKATKLIQKLSELITAMNNYEGEVQENEGSYFKIYEKTIAEYKQARQGTQKIEVLTDQGRAVVVWKLYDISDKLIDVAILETIGDGISMNLKTKVVMSIAKDFSNVTPDIIQALEKMIGRIEQQFFAREQDLQGFKQFEMMLTAYKNHEGRG